MSAVISRAVWAMVVTTRPRGGARGATSGDRPHRDGRHDAVVFGLGEIAGCVDGFQPRGSPELRETLTGSLDQVRVHVHARHVVVPEAAREQSGGVPGARTHVEQALTRLHVEPMGHGHDEPRQGAGRRGVALSVLARGRVVGVGGTDAGYKRLVRVGSVQQFGGVLGRVHQLPLLRHAVGDALPPARDELMTGVLLTASCHPGAFAVTLSARVRAAAVHVGVSVMRSLLVVRRPWLQRAGHRL